MSASFNRPSVVVGVCPHTSRLRGFVRNVVPVERPSTRQPRAWPALLAHVERLRGTREARKGSGEWTPDPMKRKRQAAKELVARFG